MADVTLWEHPPPKPPRRPTGPRRPAAGDADAAAGFEQDLEKVAPYDGNGSVDEHLDWVNDIMLNLANKWFPRKKAGPKKSWITNETWEAVKIGHDFKTLQREAKNIVKKELIK
eukprot:1347260-Lingulodinium_polyedra.AAC.1